MFVNPFLLYCINRKIGTRPSNSKKKNLTKDLEEQKDTECALTIVLVLYKTTHKTSELSINSIFFLKNELDIKIHKWNTMPRESIRRKMQIISFVSTVWLDLQLSFHYSFVIPEGVSSD